MAKVTGVQVLRYAHYMGTDSTTVYSHDHFCGSCRRKLGGAYGSISAHIEYPEDTVAKCESPHGLSTYSTSDDREFMFMAFCPWCGAEFADEWWKDHTVQNERAIDHYDHPGSHKGDTHVFAGAVAGHHLGSTDPDHVCWCQPEVTPSLMGCEIRHTVLPPPWETE